MSAAEIIIKNLHQQNNEMANPSLEIRQIIADSNAILMGIYKDLLAHNKSIVKTDNMIANALGMIIGTCCDQTGDSENLCRICKNRENKAKVTPITFDKADLTDSFMFKRFYRREPKQGENIEIANLKFIFKLCSNKEYIGNDPVELKFLTKGLLIISYLSAYPAKFEDYCYIFDVLYYMDKIEVTESVYNDLNEANPVGLQQFMNGQDYRKIQIKYNVLDVNLQSQNNNQTNKNKK